MTFPHTVAELLRELVRIPSVNPAGDPGTDGVGEERLARHLVGLLENLGAHTELREVFPGRPNLLARFPTDRSGKPKLLLAPHTDTVSVVGMTIDPFSGEIRDGKLYGRGACDTKGTIAAMLCALRELGSDAIAALDHEIWFAGLMGEETGLQGARALASQFRPDFVLVGEPTEMGIVVKHKGAMWVQIETTGKAVHASTPDQGVNAINRMAGVIERLNTYAWTQFARDQDPLLGKTTLSVGVIRGGSKVNIVPDRCHLEVDIRLIAATSADQVKADITRAVREVDPESTVEFAITGPLDTDSAHPLIQKLVNAGGRITGAPWQCDAAVFAEQGVPAVAAGPGSIAQAHTKDEWVSIEQLERGVQFYADFLRSC